MAGMIGAESAHLALHNSMLTRQSCKSGVVVCGRDSARCVGAGFDERIVKEPEADAEPQVDPNPSTDGSGAASEVEVVAKEPEADVETQVDPNPSTDGSGAALERPGGQCATEFAPSRK